MKKRQLRRGKPWEIWAAGALLFLMIWMAATRSSEASESHEIVTEGYHGSQRIKLVEKPVTPKSDVTVQEGWIDDQRINLRVIRKNEYSELRGWVGDEYISIKRPYNPDLDDD